MNNIIFNKIIGMLLQEIKLASEAKAQAETQSAANYWSGYYSGLKQTLELLLKAKEFLNYERNNNTFLLLNKNMYRFPVYKDKWSEDKVEIKTNRTLWSNMEQYMITAKIIFLKIKRFKCGGSLTWRLKILLKNVNWMKSLN